MYRRGQRHLSIDKLTTTKRSVHADGTLLMTLSAGEGLCNGKCSLVLFVFVRTAIQREINYLKGNVFVDIKKVKLPISSFFYFMLFLFSFAFRSFIVMYPVLFVVNASLRAYS